MNSRAIGLMILAMGGFAIADTFIKLMADAMSPPHTIFLLFGGSFLIFLALAVREGATLLNRAALAPIMWLRYVAEIGSAICMVSALKLVPLSTVGAILQATPLVVAAGAVLFLGEKVSWRRWSAIIVGFLGVLLIVRPGADGFDVNILFAVGAMAWLAVRDLTTPLVSKSIASSALASYSMIAATLAAFVWIQFAEDRLIPETVNWLMLAAMIGFGAVGYLLLIASTRMAPASVVSPYRYSRLIFLLVIGVVFFAERPDTLTLAGAGIIIISGLYMMWRDQKVKAGLS